MERWNVGRVERVTTLVVVVLTIVPSFHLSAQVFPTKPPRPTLLSPVRFPPFKEATFGSGLQARAGGAPRATRGIREPELPRRRDLRPARQGRPGGAGRRAPPQGHGEPLRG